MSISEVCERAFGLIEPAQLFQRDGLAVAGGITVLIIVCIGNVLHLVQCCVVVKPIHQFNVSAQISRVCGKRRIWCNAMQGLQVVKRKIVVASLACRHRREIGRQSVIAAGL